MPCYERVLFVLFQAKADKGFSRKPPFCCAESSNTVFIHQPYDKVLPLSQTVTQRPRISSAFCSHELAKKKKATQLTISLMARGEMKEGIPAIKCCSCSTDILQNGSRSSQVLTSSEYLYPSSQSRSGGKKRINYSVPVSHLVLSFGQSRDSECTNSRHTETQPFLHTHGW